MAPFAPGEAGGRVIALTRISGAPFYINATMVELVETTPDTVITLFSGRKYVVQEEASEVNRLIAEYYQRIGLLGVRAAQWGISERHES